ncbi:hypothetical protein HDF16_005250 [Granulicella aggregans]|uniref:Uncharacterized protein n=1 Tax=Granulicella aggregans TaxID=474949 RepID=A0A7W8E6N2_9BACT|nr:hypothetical protein [Granulicella aggregans]
MRSVTSIDYYCTRFPQRCQCFFTASQGTIFHVALGGIVPCPIVRILEVDNDWLQSQKLCARREGKLTYSFDAAQTENEQRLKVHMADCDSCKRRVA